MQFIHHHFDSLFSTNTQGKEALKEAPTDTYLLISTDFQTKGRGQYGRKWFSQPKETITASFCFFMDKERKDLPSLTQVLALCVVQTLNTYSLQARIKWPNDIFVNQKKIAGILCEIEPQKKRMAIVLGVGLNVTMKEETLTKIDQPATSIFMETKKEYSVSETLLKLTKLFEEALDLFKKEGFAPFLPTFQTLLLS